MDLPNVRLTVTEDGSTTYDPRLVPMQLLQVVSLAEVTICDMVVTRLFIIMTFRER